MQSTFKPPHVSLLTLLLSAPLAFAFPYDSSQSDTPQNYGVTGIEARTSGTVQTYNIPIVNWPDQIFFNSIRGGDGGRAKAIAVVGEDKIAEGGGGASINAIFIINPTNANALRPGGELRFIIGSKGEDKTQNDATGAGGGGGTAVLYRPPVNGANWEILAIAGGGGGGASSTVWTDTFSSDGKNANSETSGDDGGGDGRSGGTNGSAGVSTTGDSGGGGSYSEDSRDSSGTLWTCSGRKGAYSGGNGGQAQGYGSYGGFGCGGGGGGYVNDNGSAHVAKGGGGGGYSGGGAGGNNGTGDGQGGGGGSYLDTTRGSGVIVTRNSSRLNGTVSFTTMGISQKELNAPVISLSGSSTITLSYKGTYTDPGASAVDIYGNSITVTTTGSVTNTIPGTYTITYRATDQFGKQASTTRTVVVGNPTPPTFSITGNVTVNEDSGAYSQTSFAYNFNANDTGESLDHYTVTNNNNALFSSQPAINTSGKLTFTPASNAHGSATVTVIATDTSAYPAYANSTPRTFTITINSVADNPTNVTLSNNSIPENTTAIGTVSATDPLGGTITYSITGGADMNLLNVNSSTGILAFNSAPNYESPADANSDNQYIVQITATGSDGSTNKSFTITVTNVNEGILSMTISSTSIVENSTAVGTVLAVDEDGDQVTYSITSGADRNFFTINTNTGVLSFVSAPDYETPLDSNADNDYIVSVTATSSGGPREEAFTIAVTNIDDTSIAYFRNLYGLAANGSDDFADWSTNGIANIFYFAFGLGDPNNANIDRSRLPGGEKTAEGFVYSYVRPVADDRGLSYDVQVSTDLSQWQLLDEPSSELTEDLGDGYQRVTLTFASFHNQRFYRLAIAYNTVD